jgi:hypothetical protein
MNSRAAGLLAALGRMPPPDAHGWAGVRGLLEKHADTGFGRAHGFASIRSPEDFRAAVPPMDYEAHRSWIVRAAAGEAGVLACGAPAGFERTSGTSSGAKWIPVTEELRAEFARGLASWFDGWRRRCPAVFDGRAYWAVSPPGMPPETSAGGLPVGMQGDAAYFPEEIGACLADWLVIPDCGGDPAMVFRETAEALLAVRDLSVVSVWSPTFLLGVDAELRRLKSGFSWRGVWPKLALVSCWADASAAAWIPELRARLDGVAIEPKGLLATEGITSLPDAADGSPRLAHECHYHEFLDAGGAFTPADGLQTGAVYEVLMTTGGGLFRYRSGDLVRVTGRGADGWPRLRFIGRTGVVSDLVGEKLDERQVVAALLAADARGFLTVDAARPGYGLWIEDAGQAAAVVQLLRENPYFDQALALGQLGPVRVRALRAGWAAALAPALARTRGCRVGDVKPPALLACVDAEEVAAWLD